MIAITHEGSAEFDAALARLERRGSDDFEAVAPVVRGILSDVRRNGEEAVRRYVDAFERRRPAALVRTDYDGAGALARLPADLRAALELAAGRIEAFHQRAGREASFEYEADGVLLGTRVRPLARVGVYAPGGKARYPSSVLMTAIPARVAGVRDVVLATPAPDDAILAAAHLAGVGAVLDAGGAHAIAALAYGLPEMPRVDKIVGPGNAYVACAKRLVFGEVAIDGIAGPTEVCVAADETADAALVASDLVSQAEHDEAAYPLLVTTSATLATAVAQRVEDLLARLPRRAIAQAAVDERGVAFVVSSRARMAQIADRIAAEHLALHVADPASLLDAIPCAGAAFLGATTPVATGDYLAGPSHVLPTGGCVRFGSPLGVYDFLARTSVVRYSLDALARHASALDALSSAEGLDGHGASVRARLQGPARASAAVNEQESGY